PFCLTAEAVDGFHWPASDGRWRSLRYFEDHPQVQSMERLFDEPEGFRPIAVRAASRSGDDPGGSMYLYKEASEAEADAVNQAQLEVRRLRAPRAAAALQLLGLFNPRSAMAPISHQTKGDLALMLGETTVLQTTPKLRRDFQEVADGGAVYWPGCLCSAGDHSLFEKLYEELSPWKASPYKRSRHPACVDESLLLASATYRHVVALLREVFGVAVGYSIVNLYADGEDWTDYHRDNYKSEGNRIAAAGSTAAHDVTIGASFGAPRELRFKHLETGLEFGFPQTNGDVFAFTEPVNSAFQHCIPRLLPASSVGPRISVSAQENTWETWKSSTSPQLEKEKDAISSALSDVVQRHGFGTCSDFFREHGGRYFLEHQHHEFVFDLQNGTNCYATSSLSPHWGQVLLLLEQACTSWHAPSGQLTQLSRPVCGLLGQRLYFSGITDDDFIAEVFGTGLGMPPWTGSVLKWATEHTLTWSCYPQLWNQYVEKTIERGRQSATATIRREGEDPESPENQLMMLSATREGMVKAMTEACRELYPILEDLDLVFHMLGKKDKAKNPFFNILTVENIQREMSGLPPIKAKHKFFAKSRKSMVSLVLAKAVSLMRAVHLWTTASPSEKMIREYAMLESMVGFQAALYHGHLRWLVSPQDVVKYLRPSKKHVGTTMRGPFAPMVEGDGSAWDSCCSKGLRDLIENPVLKHIATHLLEYFVVPPQWEEKHGKTNAAPKYLLEFKDELITYFVQLKGIRRSGHRGTSCLNWWINMVMWICSMSSNPWEMLFERQDTCKDISGNNIWMRLVLEGDDSLARICRALLDKEEDNRTAYFLAFWKRLGFDMKIRRCGVDPDTKPYSEFIGTHFLLDDQLDLEGTFVPDLVRNLGNNVSTTPGTLQAFENGKFVTLRKTSAAAALSRSLDYAGILPQLSMKYLQYANECFAGDFVDEDLSYLASGEGCMSSHNVVQIINKLNCGVDILKETKTDGKDHNKEPMYVLEGKPQNCEFEILRKMYGTDVEAYEALISFPFKFGDFIPDGRYQAVLSGLSSSGVDWKVPLYFGSRTKVERNGELLAWHLYSGNLETPKSFE
ncbi:unnamed protein product, partial [Symbiodinium sp. KB8]